MSEVVIKIENLYKEYKLGVISHGTLYRDLQSWWANVRGKEDPNSLISDRHYEDAEKDSFLALNNISFDVNAGERIGIIGKNGAGKSTLLKILSRITSPTKGEIKIKGRIGSLLEVGTGFHPELTGRENIFLNGAILGMNRHEIKKKMDEIINFAGVEKHIDTPVKRYSSGMNVRLGFAVAAHLEPEILVVDEVLAVGDAEFQKKALGKMDDISKGEGRTILFVSHNMNSVLNLCNKGILIENGKIAFVSSDVEKTIRHYLKESSDSAAEIWHNNGFIDENFQPEKIWLSDKDKKTLQDSIDRDDEIFLNIDFTIKQLTDLLEIGYRLETETGEIVFSSVHTDYGVDIQKKLKKGHNSIRTKIPISFLSEGTYKITVYSVLFHTKWIINPDKYNIGVKFTVRKCLTHSPRWNMTRWGLIKPVIQWHMDE